MEQHQVVQDRPTPLEQRIEEVGMEDSSDSDSEPMEREEEEEHPRPVPAPSAIDQPQVVRPFRLHACAL